MATDCSECVPETPRDVAVINSSLVSAVRRAHAQCTRALIGLGADVNSVNRGEPVVIGMSTHLESIPCEHLESIHTCLGSIHITWSPFAHILG